MNKLQLRSLDIEGKTEHWVDGYGAVFNQLSKKLVDRKTMKFFYEIINTGAFDEVLQLPDLDVIMNFNHDDTQILARTTSGTLLLSIDDYGLKYSFKLPDTNLGRDLKELIERGDIYESSFAFIPDTSSIKLSKHEDGTIIKTINKVIGLFDTSIVINGAYKNTSINLRDFEAMEAELLKIEQPDERQYNEIENLKLKLSILKYIN